MKKTNLKKFSVTAQVIYIILEGIVKLIFSCLYVMVTETYKEIMKEVNYQKLIRENQRKEEEIKQLEQQQQINYLNNIKLLKSLLKNTENKLYYSIEKTEFPNENRIREYINFYTYNKETCIVENSNNLINTLFNNNLVTYKGKSKKLNGTIVLEDYQCDKKDITNKISTLLNTQVKLILH